MTAEIIVMPNQPDVEEAILSACFDHDELTEYVARIKPEYFYREANRLIFSAMQQLHAECVPIDLLSLKERMRRNGTLARAGGAAALARLYEYPPAQSAEFFSRALVDFWARRESVSAANNLAKRAQDPQRDGTEGIRNTIAFLTQLEAAQAHEDACPIPSLLESACARYEASGKARRPIVGVPTGYRHLDAVLCGLQPGQLVILAARPGMGKTSFALNIARNAAAAGKKTVIISLEMTRDELADRLISSAAGIPTAKLRSGYLSHDDWADIAEAQENLHKLPLSINDSAALHYRDIASMLRRIKARQGCDLIILDYLQLVRGDNQRSHVEEVTSVSRAMKAVAKEIGAPMLSLSQLSRACESRPDKRPILSDLRDSGAIEQDADIVLFIYRDDYYDIDCQDHRAEILIAKNRSGPTGRVWLEWRARTTEFVDCIESQM